MIYIHFDPKRLTRLGWTLATLSSLLVLVGVLAACTQAPRPIAAIGFIGCFVVLLVTGLLDTIGDSVHIPEARLRHQAEDAAAKEREEAGPPP